MRPSPSRRELKDAMLAIFMEQGEPGKKQRSKEFTRLLFDFVESRMEGKSEDDVYMKQMEAIGLFSQYIFRKHKEKEGEKGKHPNELLKEIAEESDELYDEIEGTVSP